MMMRFRDSPEPAKSEMCAPGSDDKIMHACFRIGNTQIMASDGRAQGKPIFQGFALSVSAKDEADADRLFKALIRVGKCRCLAKTFFSPRFGMVADRFRHGGMVMRCRRGRGQVEDFVISRVFGRATRNSCGSASPRRAPEALVGPKGFKEFTSKVDLRCRRPRTTTA